MVLFGATVPAILAYQAPAPATGKVNPDSVILGDFTNRVAEYVKLRKKVKDALPGQKPTSSQSAIARHEQDLAKGIREAREHASPGDIFTPEISVVFKRLILGAMKGSKGAAVQQSLQRAEPVQLVLRVNREYPAGLPLQSTPPTLLANLPSLPKEVDYRLVGPNLILRDVEANLIIDFITRALPQ
jgi:hypothetical protein